ncbi:hypothetical protein RG677_000382 [Vibrio parahaemolyticus]|uniref:hypothetical protein n=1 Tax=Vibrio parahaemolyticus TaxID=670 RepID=UPI0004E6AB2A|nr:hypothetical protein [Vibrio parahaemolyticus]AWG86380.1 hypothetical protein Vp2S01_A0895 [Vibrio parahaemolyticus]EGR1756237.1 hypothetical protein [Vibrio parahaemolyticus]EJB8570679.1 hypothetical protein [Vibrio parahaemolyticus]ELB2091571.1 hypothetical protein [Vibrio parahaemolyticus]ELB2123614.1 hypothetical protein [Vibrio parahaemolyticus]
MIGWIYIGADCEKLRWCKVGKTAGDLKTRHRSPQNPNYFIYGAFRIIDGDLGTIETYLHEALDGGVYNDIHRYKHFGTGSPSECYELNPQTMMNIIEGLILDKFRSSVSVTVYDTIRYNYMCSEHYSRWYWDDDKQTTDEWLGIARAPHHESQLSRQINDRDRNGTVRSGDEYEVRTTIPLIELGDNQFIDQETGETIDFDELDDDEDF